MSERFRCDESSRQGTDLISSSLRLRKKRCSEDRGRDISEQHDLSPKTSFRNWPYCRQLEI